VATIEHLFLRKQAEASFAAITCIPRRDHDIREEVSEAQGTEEPHRNATETAQAFKATQVDPGRRKAGWGTHPSILQRRRSAGRPRAARRGTNKNPTFAKRRQMWATGYVGHVPGGMGGALG